MKLKKKVPVVTKHGHKAIWSVKSIRGIGYEDKYYVHQKDGRSISVESAINKSIETPLSQSETWHKITAGKAELLDISDKPKLYELFRNLTTRTPHQFETEMELARLSVSSECQIPFTDEEREYFVWMLLNPDKAREMFNRRASTLDWTRENYEGSGVFIYRSPIPLRTSTVPVLVTKAPPTSSVKVTATRNGASPTFLSVESIHACKHGAC